MVIVFYAIFIYFPLKKIDYFQNFNFESCIVHQTFHPKKFAFSGVFVFLRRFSSKKVWGKFQFSIFGHYFGHYFSFFNSE